MDRKEGLYISFRKFKALFQSVPFYLFRNFPIRKRKIVFTTIEGTTGFTCNPKYIALELLERNRKLQDGEKYELVWLVNNEDKVFPEGIKKVKNSLWNRARELTTARVWIDNSRKQLECRKRKGQIYIQTWHAKLGFKPTCLDRGASFSQIAYLVSKHDSDMVDYWLSNSDWYDKTLKTGSLYEGKTIRCGSPRCDILVRACKDIEYKNKIKKELVKRLGIGVTDSKQIHFLMYAPTFRGGSQSIDRSLDDAGHMPDFQRLINSLETTFGGDWRILLRLHPQMTVRNISSNIGKSDDAGLSDKLFDVSKIDDMYEVLAGCDAFLTDYSSAAFDAAIMEIPVFLYCDDYKDYENERGRLLWDLKKLPFPLAENDDELSQHICGFLEKMYLDSLHQLISSTGMVEDGKGSKVVADFLSFIISGRV